MARIKRYSPFLNLSRYQVFINDTVSNSKYFRINELSDIFTGGKNGFLIEGTPFLRETTDVRIEILDVQGNPIYVQPGDGAPEYYEGLSKLISIHVYDDTPIGVGRITILGELKEYENNIGEIVPVPDEWVGAYNVKWERDILINRNLNNETIVRFFYRPQVTITEFEKPVFERTVPIVTHTGSVAGVPETPPEGIDLTNWGAGTLYKLTRISGPSFSSSMDENIISLPSINFSPRIIEVLNDDEVLVNLAYTDASNIVRPFTETGYTASFEYGDVISETTTLGSFAKIDIRRLETFVGDVARVKIFRKSRNTAGDYTLVQESKLESTELLKDVTTTSNTETFYGIFNLNTLFNYWESGSSVHPVSINYSVLSDSVKVDYDTVSGGTQTLKTIESYPLTKDTEYTLSFRTLLSGSISPNKKLKAFVSSSISTQKIVELSGSNDFITREPISANIIAENTSDSKLVFEFTGDDWYISNVSFRAASDTSFSPDEFSIVQNVPRKLTSETFDFRFEFYDINNNYIPVDVFASKEFTAGNDFGGGTAKLLTFESTQNAFRFSTGSLANPPFQQIQFTTTINGVTGSLTYYSAAFDIGGNYIEPQEYMSQSLYEWLQTLPETSSSLVDLYFEGYNSTPSFIYGALSGVFSGSITNPLSDVTNGSLDGDFSGSLISLVTQSAVFIFDASYPNSWDSGSDTWSDLSGNGYDSILSGSTRITYNETGEYFDFNNPTVRDSTGFYITNLNYITGPSDKIENLTIDAFIRNNSQVTNSIGDQRILLSFDKSSVFRFSIGSSVTAIRTEAEGKPYFGWTGAVTDDGTSTDVDTYAQDFTGDLRDDEWHHVCVTFSTASVVFYIDGEPVTNINNTFTPIGNQATTETPRYGWIGAGSEATFAGGDTNPAANFHGSLGTINMYYETFTHEQVLQNFNALRHRYGISATSASIGTALIDTVSGSYTGSITQGIDSSSFSYPNYPGLLTNASNNGATLLVSNFTGSLASYTIGSILYTASIEDLIEYETVFRLEDGDNAPTLIVTSNANQFIYEPTALEPKPAGQTINIRAQRKNLASLITPITVNSSSLSGNPPPLSFVGTDTARGIDTYSITALEYSASNADTAFPETTYQFSGSDVFGNVYSDEVTISPVINFDGISVVLSNETTAFRANSIGFVNPDDFSQGNGTVDVRIAGKIIPHSEGLGGKNVFDIISASASTGLTANEVNPTTNSYGISAMSVDSGSLDLLIRYEAGDGITTVDFTKKVTYTKNRSATPVVVVNPNPVTQGVTATSGFTVVTSPVDITFSVTEAGTPYSYNSLGASNPYEYVITSVNGGTNNNNGTITPNTPTNINGITGSVQITYINSEGTTTSGYTQDFFVTVGVDGRRTKTGQLNYQISSSTAPFLPTATSYSFDDNSFFQLTSNWGVGTPIFSGSNQAKYWYCIYNATEDASGAGTATTSLGNLDFESVNQSIGFAGLVTFTEGSDETNGPAISDGTGNVISLGPNGTTLVSANVITTGILKSENYSAGTAPFTSAGTIFYLNDGNLYSNQFGIQSGNAFFKGAITGGTIRIGSGTSVFSADTNGLYLGNTTFSSAPFRVTPQGALTATNASITGTITATAGSIGGWNITQTDGIYKLDSGTPTSSPNNGMVMDPAGGSNGKAVIRIYDGTTVRAALGNYASGVYGVFANEGSIGGWAIGSTSLSNGNIAIKTSPQAGFEIFDGSTLKVSVNENSAFSSSANLNGPTSFTNQANFYTGTTTVTYHNYTTAVVAEPDFAYAVLATGSTVADGYISTNGVYMRGELSATAMATGNELYVTDISSSVSPTATDWAQIVSGTTTYFSTYHWIVFEIHDSSDRYEHQLLYRTVLASGIVKYENSVYVNSIKSHGPSSYISKSNSIHYYRWRHIIVTNYFEGSATLRIKAFNPIDTYPLQLFYGNSTRLSELNNSGLRITNGRGNSLTVNTSGSVDNYLRIQGNSEFKGNVAITGSILTDALDVNSLIVGSISLKGKNLLIDGNLRATGDIYAYSSSDRRLKDNLIPIKDAIKKLNNLTGYEFDWNQNSKGQLGHDYGVVAQEVQEILPEIVAEKVNNYLGVKYEKIIPLLIQAIKEQQIQIDELKKLLNK